MTLDEVKKYKIPDSDMQLLNDFQTTDYSDNPKLSKEELKQFKPWYELPKNKQSKQADLHIKIDIDILDALKAQGSEYNTKINTILREAILGH